jgi:hypothetical protein
MSNICVWHRAVVDGRSAVRSIISLPTLAADHDASTHHDRQWRAAAA